jgi:bacterioferritin-associated ferredoxin
MYVCICHAVNETSIRGAVAAGHRSLSDLRKHLGVAGHCGRCAAHARGILSEALGCDGSGGCGECGAAEHRAD